MRDKEHRGEGRPEDLLQELGYETQDIKYKEFSVYGAYFFGFFIFCVIAGFFIMLWMSPTGLRGGRMGDYIPKTTMPLSEPLLQTNISARTDIMSLRRKETAAMTTAGVIDQSHGVYRIPIDQAVDDVANASDSDRAAMGLPASAPNVPATSSSVGVSRQEALANAMNEPDFSPSQGSPSSQAPTAKPGAQAAAVKPSTAKPISNSAAKPALNNRGESATTKPKGGNGGK